MTGQVAARLAELGLELPPVVAPLAAYVPAVIAGDLVYVSGQLPMVDGALGVTGKVGTDVSPEVAKELAAICALNAIAAADSVIGSADRITRVVRVGGFVAADPAFTAVPGVINGASELFGEVFGEAGRHARAAVGVAVLPLDSPVEVDVIFQFA